MSYYQGDQNQLAFFYESGTYASVSGAGQWLGLVQNHTADENENRIESRYLGTASRNVSTFLDGARDVKGNFTYFPQDWRILKFAFGKCADAGSPSPYSHTYTEANGTDSCPEISGQILPSFTLEDAQITATGSNFVRTINGCEVDAFTVNFRAGEPIEASVDYTAKQAVFSSGAKATITAATTVPYMWSDFSLHIPSGTAFNQIIDGSFKVMNTLSNRHYVDGSRTTTAITPGNRNYELNLTVDGTDANTKALYDQYFLGGSEFNCMLRGIVSAGSRDVYFVMSGCSMTDMSAPSTNDSATNTQTLTIHPQTVSVVENNEYQYFNAGSYQ